jgi:hypothetical protein
MARSRIENAESYSVFPNDLRNFLNRFQLEWILDALFSHTVVHRVK